MPNDFNAMMGPPPAVVPGINAMTGTASLPAAIAGLPPEQQAAAARRAEILGALGQGLAGRPYAERRALLAHLTPQLAARGLPPAAVARFDPTDANLAGVVEQATRLRGLLAPGS